MLIKWEQWLSESMHLPAQRAAAGIGKTIFPASGLEAI